jgi:hypothetical protein
MWKTSKNPVKTIIGALSGALSNNPKPSGHQAIKPHQSSHQALILDPQALKPSSP